MTCKMMVPAFGLALVFGLTGCKDEKKDGGLTGPQTEALKAGNEQITLIDEQAKVWDTVTDPGTYADAGKKAIELGTKIAAAGEKFVKSNPTPAEREQVEAAIKKAMERVEAASKKAAEKLGNAIPKNITLPGIN